MASVDVVGSAARLWPTCLTCRPSCSQSESPGCAAYRLGVERLLVVAGATVALWAVCCVLMMFLASRLPPGLLRQVAEFLPSCVATARTLRRSPDVPRRAKVALLIAVVWVVSPIDLLPEFLPVIGPLDDVVAVILLLRYAAKEVCPASHPGGCLADRPATARAAAGPRPRDSAHAFRIRLSS